MEWTCELFIAPSTIPNAGLGIYTGKTLRPGDAVGGTGDIAIPIIDLEWKNAELDGKYFPNPFDDYVWDGRYMGMWHEVEGMEDITTFWPGVDAAINSFPALINLQRALPGYDPDINGTMHRSKDPAMGSFSPYFGGASIVSHYVPEGGELFKYYGNHWFLDRKMKFPLITDFFRAEELLLWFSVTVAPNVKPQVYQLLLDIKEIWNNPKILQAIPDSWESAQNVVRISKPNVIKRKLRDWYQPNATRSLEWLQEHGACLESIRTAPSTIDGAGRGAFATRAFQVGEIVTTSPLIHILNKTMFEGWGDTGHPDQFGGQLLINYCFSHPEISLALCPYGKGINSINHAPDKVNVRVEWPPNQFLNHNSTLLTIPPGLWSTSKPQLSLHYIATKPIGAGDELFLDYGPEWQNAWEDHVIAWRLSDASFLLPHGRDYISAVQWNRRHEGRDVLWTSEEIDEDDSRLVPPFLQLRCHSGILDVSASSYDQLRWEADVSKRAEKPVYGHPCRVTNRRSNGEDHSYEVFIEVEADGKSSDVKEIKRSSVPRRLLKWFDVPHTTDIHTKPAFRHSLGLPDEIVPKEWRVIASSEHASDEQSCQQEQNDYDTDGISTCRATTSQTSGNNVKSHNNLTQESKQCGIYLASSSIPGAGLGLFAGKAYFEGDRVGPSDIAIPVLSSWIAEEDDEIYALFQNPFEDYVWENAYLGMGANKEGDDAVGVLWPGINALVNCYPVLTNLRLIPPEYDTGKIHRFRHPGAGAFSPYRNGGARALRYIPPGGELFENYGERYLLDRPSFQSVPILRDVKTVRNLLEMYFDLPIGDFRHYKFYDIMKNVATIWQPRLANVLPTTYDDAEAIMEFFRGDFGRLHQPNRTRDLSWLGQHGRCIDTIIPKESTLEGAGIGAFAKDFFAKGTILTSSPVLRVRRHWLEKTSYGPNGEETALDILWNYCFGAPSSSLLMCPYSSGINYINHNQSLANVRVQWAKHGDLVQDDSSFDVPPSEVDYLKQKPVLVFDYVVTKDIEEGEEIFLDYGDEFEEAWRRHVLEWKPKPWWESHMSAKDLNVRVMEEGILRTEEEQEINPYPNNVVLRCHSSLESDTLEELRSVSADMDVEAKFVWVDPVKVVVDYGKPCEILRRVPSEDGFLYDVEVIVGGTAEDFIVVKRAGVPKEAFRFFDEPYTKDIHLKNAFRHFIGLPDAMIPSAWRDFEVPE